MRMRSFRFVHAKARRSDRKWKEGKEPSVLSSPHKRGSIRSRKGAKSAKDRKDLSFLLHELEQLHQLHELVPTL